MSYYYDYNDGRFACIGGRIDDFIERWSHRIAARWAKFRGIKTPVPEPQLAIPAQLTAEALRILSTQMKFTNRVNRDYAYEFGERPTTINIRKPPVYTVRAGKIDQS